MPVLHVSVSSPLPPQETVRRLTNFSSERAKSWPGVSDNNLTVHNQGDGWAEVTEGNKIAWERQRYTWDAASRTVSAVTLKSSSNGEYRWKLRASNGQVIATGGEGYSSKAAARSGIESVKRVAESAPIEEASASA